MAVAVEALSLAMSRGARQHSGLLMQSATPPIEGSHRNLRVLRMGAASAPSSLASAGMAGVSTAPGSAAALPSAAVALSSATAPCALPSTFRVPTTAVNSCSAGEPGSVPWASSAQATLWVESAVLKLRFPGEPESLSLSFSALCFRVSGEQSSSIISVWTFASARIFSPRSFKLAVSQAVTIPLAISATRTRKRWEDPCGDPWRSCCAALSLLSRRSFRSREITTCPAISASEAQTSTAKSGTALFKGISERLRRAGRSLPTMALEDSLRGDPTRCEKYPRRDARSRTKSGSSREPYSKYCHVMYCLALACFPLSQSSGALP